YCKALSAEVISSDKPFAGVSKAGFFQNGAAGHEGHAWKRGGVCVTVWHISCLYQHEVHV
ncbi:MAG: hypothetical protein KAJ05_03525, partial [Candidatus Latescibacteria bacterium]|nr:hypothetical protein [Candidatus Latescibacterota bacterium]